MRKELKEFAKQCEIVLQRNDHKDGWNECEMDFLLGKLMEEVGEVARMLVVDNKGQSPYLLYEECCDVANIAMMIADNWGKIPRTNGDGP